MPGGINLKALAISKLKRDLAFRPNFEGQSIPVASFEDWCSAANTLLSFRIAGVSTLRFAAKRIAEARVYWKSQKQQEALNVVSDRLVQAEQRCNERATKRQEKRLLRGVLPGVTDRMIESEKKKAVWQQGDPGRRPLGINRLPPGTDQSPKPVPQSSPSTDFTELLKRGIAELKEKKS